MVFVATTSTPFVCETVVSKLDCENFIVFLVRTVFKKNLALFDNMTILSCSKRLAECRIVNVEVDAQEGCC